MQLMKTMLHEMIGSVGARSKPIFLLNIYLWIDHMWVDLILDIAHEPQGAIKSQIREFGNFTLRPNKYER